MERTIYRHLILTVVLMLIWQTPLWAQDRPCVGHTCQNLIYRSYVEDRMSLWESTLETMEFEYSLRPDDVLLYDILLAQYGLIGYSLGTDNKSKARSLLNNAEEYLEKLENTPGYEAASRLFQAVFYAYQITLRPWRIVQLGIASERLINEALELKDDYPRGYLEKANMLYFAPVIFGGSKKRSIEYYSQAVSLFEENMQNNHRWLYLSTLVSLANAYESTGDVTAAIATLEKALEFEPGFRWAKNELLPELREKM